MLVFGRARQRGLPCKLSATVSFMVRCGGCEAGAAHLSNDDAHCFQGELNDNRNPMLTKSPKYCLALVLSKNTNCDSMVHDVVKTGLGHGAPCSAQDVPGQASTWRGLVGSSACHLRADWSAHEAPHVYRCRTVHRPSSGRALPRAKPFSCRKHGRGEGRDERERREEGGGGGGWEWNVGVGVGVVRAGGVLGGRVGGGRVAGGG